MGRRLRSKNSAEIPDRGRPEFSECELFPPVPCCPTTKPRSVLLRQPTNLSGKRLPACFFLRTATPLPYGAIALIKSNGSNLGWYARSDCLRDRSLVTFICFVTRFDLVPIVLRREGPGDWKSSSRASPNMRLYLFVVKRKNTTCCVFILGRPQYVELFREKPTIRIIFA